MALENDQAKYEKAKKRVKDIKEFYTHLIVYVCVMVLLVIINLVTMYTGGYAFYWFIFPLVGWGFGIFWHAMGVFVFSRGKTSDWEKRKIEEIKKEMEEQEK